MANSSTKRKLSDDHVPDLPAKRLKITREKHPDRTPVLHTVKGKVVKASDYIDFRTVVPQSICAGHAPDELISKADRRAWRDEQRRIAAGVQGLDAADYVKTANARHKPRDARLDPNSRIKGWRVDVAANTATADATGTAYAPAIDIRQVARTQLARVPVQQWHHERSDDMIEPGASVPKAQAPPDDAVPSRTDAAKACVDRMRARHGLLPLYGRSSLQQSQSAKQAPHLRHAPAVLYPSSQSVRLETEADPVAKSSGPILAPKLTSTKIVKRQGLQRFDGDLSAYRQPLVSRPLDESDGTDESDSSDSNDQEDVPQPPIRGSFAESFADRIFGDGQEDEDITCTGGKLPRALHAPDVARSEELDKDSCAASDEVAKSAESVAHASSIKEGNDQRNLVVDHQAEMSERGVRGRRGGSHPQRRISSTSSHGRNELQQEMRLEESAMTQHGNVHANQDSSSRASIPRSEEPDHSIPVQPSEPSWTAINPVHSQTAVVPGRSLETKGTPPGNSQLSTRQANTGLKRVLDGGKAGCDLSGHGQPQMHKARHNTHPLDELSTNRLTKVPDASVASEDDVYDTIDTVTQNVLGDSVASIEECKPPRSQKSSLQESMGPLMTMDDSEIILSTEQDQDTVKRDEHGGQHTVAAGLDADGISESVGLAPSSQDSNYVRNRVSSPSTLTELSRSPSPVVTFAIESTSASEERHLADPAGQDILLPRSASPQVQTTPHSKRKMTGMSSKHFSVATGPRRSNAEDRSAVQDPKSGGEAGQESNEASESELSELTSREPTPSTGSNNVAQADATSPLTALQRAIDEPCGHTQQTGIRALRSTPAKLDQRATATRKPRRRSRKASTSDDPAPEDDLVASKTPVAGLHEADVGTADSVDVHTPLRQIRAPTRTPASKRRSTGKISDHFITDRVDLYNTTTSSRKVPAGTSRVPVPPIHVKSFGIIQEKIWREPFWLIIAVTFLNKTTGRSAVPVFWKLKGQYPTCQALAEAKQGDLLKMVHHLGLQNQRSKRLIQIAKAWAAAPPVAGKRYRTLNYPSAGDGRASKTAPVVEEDNEDCAGLLEIGAIPGCGQYAYDSWRIFCRDVLRGVADDYNGANATNKDLVPEWQRVLPDDKELRACLRWMWLREGWIWNPVTGEKRRATEDEMEKAVKGEMDIEDPQERKFAEQAAGVDVGVESADRGGEDRSLEETAMQTPSKLPLETKVEKSNDCGHDVAMEARTIPRAMIQDAAAKSTKRGSRGRSKKDEAVNSVEDDAAETPANIQPKPRKRGRPEKTKPSDIMDDSNAAAPTSPKQKRTTSPAWHFPTAEQSTILTPDGRRASARHRSTES